jgi:hypothetical protein
MKCSYSVQGDYTCTNKGGPQAEGVRTEGFEPDCSVCSPGVGKYDPTRKACMCERRVAAPKAALKPCKAKCKYGRCESCPK